MGEGNLSCTASCLLLKHKLLFHWKSEGKRLVQPKGKLTGKDGEDAWDRRHIYPALAVFIETSRSLLPIGKVFISVRGANKKTCRHVSPKISMASSERAVNILGILTSNIILSSDYQKTIVGVRANTTALLSFAICTVRRWESAPRLDERDF